MAQTTDSLHDRSRTQIAKLGEQRDHLKDVAQRRQDALKRQQTALEHYVGVAEQRGILLEKQAKSLADANAKIARQQAQLKQQGAAPGLAKDEIAKFDAALTDLQSQLDVLRKQLSAHTS